MSERIPGSFRDPSGHVYEDDGSIFRVVAPVAAEAYEAVRDANVFQDLVEAGRLVDLTEISTDRLGASAADAAYLLQHRRLAHISYPYEWSFSLLRDAALFHLDLHLDLLERGFTLSDASCYNVQFEGPRPIFIDHLSIQPYREGEFWTGHRQFCEQFLNPLLLRALFGVPHNSWYRGNLEGIPAADIAKLLRFRDKLSWNVLVHVVLPNKFQQGATTNEKIEKAKTRTLPLTGYKAMLSQLRNWISRLTPDRIGNTVWGDYATTNTYTSDDEIKKRQFIADFVKSSATKSIVDLGCNTGEYTKVALSSGAERALGFDFDQKALDQAHHRAKEESLNFLPLFLDARNPSPDQGWMQTERTGHAARTKADAVMALAFEHHLAIAHNVPLDDVIAWIVDIAPTGVIEFVPKEDSTIQRMLSMREDIFPNYNQESFEAALAKHARVERKDVVSGEGRTLYAFDRS